MNQFHRFVAVPAAVLFVLGPGVLDAGAVVLLWKSPVNGNAGLAANWQPAQIPGAADAPTFNVGGSYTVTFDNTVPTTSVHVHRSGVVTLVCATNHSTGSTVRVGDLSGDVGTMRLTTGTFTAGSTVTVGNAAGSTGTLNVDDDDADLLQSGTTADVIVGHLGIGTLNVTGGGLVDAADDVIVGNSTGQGTVLVSGVNASPQVRSTLSSSGADGDFVFGSAGSAIVTITAGGQAFAADDVRIAVGPASHGTVTVRGTDGPNEIGSALTVGGNLEIASNPLSVTSNGVGELTIQDTAFVSVTDTTRVGDSDGGTGTLRMRPGGSLVTGSLDVNDAHGVLDFQGGTIIVKGGVFNPPGTTLVLDDPQFESVSLENGATSSFDGGSSAGYSLILGDATKGSMRLAGGPHLTQVKGVLSVGLSPGSLGRLELFDTSLLDGAGTIVVGQGGSGQLTISGGSDLSLTGMSVAYSPGSSGVVNFAGTGSTLTLGSLNIGGSANAAGGTASVTVGNGAVLTTNGSGSSTVRVWHPGASLEIQSGGTATVKNNLDLRGHLLLSGGLLNVGNLNLNFGADVVGNGTVAGNVNLVTSDCLIHAVGGSLTLGNATSTLGFSNAGSMVIDTSTVTLQDSNGSSLGNVVLHSGTLNLGAGFNSVQAGRTMSGVGVVNGNLAIQGTLAPGASAGTITVQGTFQNTTPAHMAMEIGDAASNQFDRLVSTGAVTLAGTLDVQVLPGFLPDPGEDYTLITGASRTGTFSTVTLDGQPVNGQFTLNYTATSVVLHVNQLTVDVPESGGGLPRELAFSGHSGDGTYAGFELALPEAARVSVGLYSATGRFLGTLLDGDRAAGVVRLPLRALGRDLSGGVYFGRVTVRSTSSERIRSAKVTLIK